MSDLTPPDPFVSRTQAATEIGKSTWWIDQMIQDGQLQVWKVGRRTVIYRNSLEAWKAQHQPPMAPAESA